MKRIPFYVALAVLCLAMTDCTSKKKMEIKMKPYPQTAKVDVSDNYHGTVVADPYRWLEDDNSAETAAWVAAENEVTFDYLSQIPYRPAIDERLTELWNYEKIGAPTRVGDRYFYFRNDGLRTRASSTCLTASMTRSPRSFSTPMPLSADGTAALNSVAFSGRREIYGLRYRQVGFRLGGDIRQGGPHGPGARRCHPLGEVLRVRTGRPIPRGSITAVTRSRRKVPSFRARTSSRRFTTTGWVRRSPKTKSSMPTRFTRSAITTVSMTVIRANTSS